LTGVRGKEKTRKPKGVKRFRNKSKRENLKSFKINTSKNPRKREKRKYHFEVF